MVTMAPALYHHHGNHGLHRGYLHDLRSDSPEAKALLIPADYSAFFSRLASDAKVSGRRCFYPPTQAIFMRSQFFRPCLNYPQLFSVQLNRLVVGSRLTLLLLICTTGKTSEPAHPSSTDRHRPVFQRPAARHEVRVVVDHVAPTQRIKTVFSDQGAYVARVTRESVISHKASTRSGTPATKFPNRSTSAFKKATSKGAFESPIRRHEEKHRVRATPRQIGVCLQEMPL